MSSTRILFPFSLYLLALLSAVWLLCGALGISDDRSFQPVPRIPYLPAVDSVSLTNEISAVFAHRPWYLFVLFGIFLSLWSGLGLVFWGNVSTRWRISAVSFSGSLLIAYAFLLLLVVLSSIISVAVLSSVYFVGALILAVAGPLFYWLSVSKLESESDHSGQEFKDVVQALSQISSLRIPNELAQLQNASESSIYRQNKLVSGSILSTIRYSSARKEALTNVQAFLRDAETFILEEVSAALSVLDDPALASAKDELVREFISEEDQRILGLNLGGR